MDLSNAYIGYKGTKAMERNNVSRFQATTLPNTAIWKKQISTARLLPVVGKDKNTIEAKVTSKVLVTRLGKEAKTRYALTKATPVTTTSPRELVLTTEVGPTTEVPMPSVVTTTTTELTPVATVTPPTEIPTTEVPTTIPPETQPKPAEEGIKKFLKPYFDFTEFLQSKYKIPKWLTYGLTIYVGYKVVKSL